MYLLIDAMVLDVVACSYREYDESLTMLDVFPQAEPPLLLAWCKYSYIPEHFVVDDDNKIRELSVKERLAQGKLTLEDDEKIVGNEIVRKSLAEQIDEGVMKLSPQQKLVAGQVVQKSIAEQVAEGIIELEIPFQYVKDNSIDYYTVEQVLAQELVTDLAQANKVKEKLNLFIVQKIKEKYPESVEIKITKNYAQWLSEGKSTLDNREDKFIQMQLDIERIKAEYAPLKNQVNKLIQSYSHN